MKKSLSLGLFFFLFCTAVTLSQAQQVPQGMKYQAAARNLTGQVLANKPVTLKISLNSKPTGTVITHYSETHTVITNSLGLFDLTIGAGKVGAGTFENVPWSSEDIWMEVAMEDSGKSGFSTISSSRLLAVPYAFHAMTANELAGNPTARVAATDSKGLPESCACEGGISQIKLLYTGPSNVTIRAYRDDKLKELLNTFTGVQTGAILTISAPGYPDKKLKYNTFIKVEGTGLSIPLVNVPTDCDVAAVGENFGNFSMLSRTDRYNNQECTVCDVRVHWKVGGNGLLSLCNQLGTKSNTDLIFITNNIERLKITKEGDINIANSLKVGNDVEVGNDLTVKRNVFLNTTGGATFNNGPLTVNNLKPTLLTGTLNVNGATNLNNILNVGGNTTLNGLTNITNTTLSGNTTSGALTVGGGVGIFRNLNVGGIVKFTDLTESSSTTIGALTVSGGVGIANRINVGGAAQFNSTLITNGAATLKSTLNVNGNTYLDGTLNADGATTLRSTLNVTGATTLSNKLDANGQVTINADVNGGDNSYNAYPLRVQGSNQGIAIKVDGSRNNSNNFVVFMDANGIQGRIEGQTTSELESSQEYKTQVALYALEGVATTADIAGLAAEGVALAAALITAPAAVGVGAQGAAVLVRAAALVTESVTWSDDVHANVGVAYESGSGDYAEWLERGKTEEDMIFGQIVGVKGGKISLRTDEADHYMAISKSPIVLGNMPEANREKDYEKVAFMGQVPVRVVGKVAIGDYIIPSGNHDGLGLAVHPADMKLGDYARIVGVAWQAAEDMPLNIVNVAVGINTNDLTSKMVSMSQRLDSLSQKTDNILAFLQGKAPLQTTHPVAGVPSVTANVLTPSASAQTTLAKTMSDADFDRTIDKAAPQLRLYFEEARNQLNAKGIDVSGNPYLSSFFNDPIASVKQLRRDPTLSTQWGRVDQKLQQKKNK